MVLDSRESALANLALLNQPGPAMLKTHSLGVGTSCGHAGGLKLLNLGWLNASNRADRPNVRVRNK